MDENALMIENDAKVKVETGLDTSFHSKLESALCTKHTTRAVCLEIQILNSSDRSTVTQNLSYCILKFFRLFFELCGYKLPETHSQSTFHRQVSASEKSIPKHTDDPVSYLTFLKIHLSACILRFQ